jgi:hypothetical protein
MSIVLFNREDEFIKELQIEFKDHPRCIVRVTNCLRPSRIIPLKMLYVEATAKTIDEKDIITLERYCGDLWGQDEVDGKTYDKSEKVMNEIKDACRELALEVRAGVYEEEK